MTQNKDKMLDYLCTKYFNGNEQLIKDYVELKIKEKNKIWLEKIKGLKYKAFFEYIDEAYSIYMEATNDVEIQSLLGRTKREEDHKKIKDLLTEARVFILDSNLSPLDEGECEKIQNDAVPISLPFKTCSFEMVGKNCFAKFDDCVVLSILLHEYSGGIFTGAEFRYSETDGISWCTISDDIALIYAKLMNASLKRCKSGIEKVNERFRIGKGKNRELRKIKEVIRVSPKGLKPEDYQRPLLGRSIDWSHQWEVMGHWRKTESIGKDQSGDYCVEGFTWVTPHIKGPENKNLIKKTRIISPDIGLIG